MAFEIAKHAPKSFNQILNRTYKNELNLVEVKNGAYDSNWLDEYTHFYSKQLNSQPFVKRLIFKDKRTYMGFTHVRPVSDAHKISETYLAPPREMREDSRCFLTCRSVYDVYGEKKSSVYLSSCQNRFSVCVSTVQFGLH